MAAVRRGWWWLCAGFGGLGGARAGPRRMRTHADRPQRLCDTFQPLLYEVATGGLTSSDVAYPACGRQPLQHQAAFRHGELGLTSTPRRGRSPWPTGRRLGYDYLILATGVAAAYHGIPGAAEYSLGLYTRHDAIVLRDRIMIGLEHISPGSACARM